MLGIFYYVSLIFVINFVLIKSDKALLFDVVQNSIVQQRLGISGVQTDLTVCDYCVIACPESNLEELTYSYRNSIGKKVLLVKKNYEAIDSEGKIELPECNKPIEPSVVLNKNSGLIEIGYEIHDRNEIINHSQSQLNNKKDQFLSLYPCSSYEDPQPRQVLSNYMKSDEKNFPLEENTKGFNWIPLLSIDFNIDIMSPTRIKYYSDIGIHQRREDCDQFHVGEEFYNMDTHRSAYSYENQRLLFTGKKESRTSKGGSQCGQKYGCLVQHQIIPSYYFHSDYGARAICTRMNTVPIWDSIVERINIVDKYIYVMSQIWKSNITITNGFFGIYKPSKEYFKKPAAGQDLYLDPSNNQIPVPLIFYKIVQYEISAAPTETINRHYAVIIIHNDPTPDASKQRICEEYNAIKGWEEIQNLDPQSGLTYVCAFDVKVIRKLELVEKKYEGTTYKLDLDFFLTYDTVEERLTYKSKKSEIRDKLRELF